MYKVCANYCGTVIMLEEFSTEQEAEEFMTELGKVLVGNTAPSGTKEK